jgi:hypothetical protein
LGIGLILTFAAAFCAAIASVAAMVSCVVEWTQGRRPAFWVVLMPLYFLVTWGVARLIFMSVMGPR